MINFEGNSKTNYTVSIKGHEFVIKADYHYGEMDKYHEVYDQENLSVSFIMDNLVEIQNFLSLYHRTIDNNNPFFLSSLNGNMSVNQRFYYINPNYEWEIVSAYDKDDVIEISQQYHKDWKQNVYFEVVVSNDKDSVSLLMDDIEFEYFWGEVKKCLKELQFKLSFKNNITLKEYLKESDLHPNIDIVQSDVKYSGKNLNILYLSTDVALYQNQKKIAFSANAAEMYLKGNYKLGDFRLTITESGVLGILSPINVIARETF